LIKIEAVEMAKIPKGRRIKRRTIPSQRIAFGARLQVQTVDVDISQKKV